MLADEAEDRNDRSDRSSEMVRGSDRTATEGGDRLS